MPDTPQKRAQYEEQVIRTFYVSHADVAELATLLTQVVRAPTLAVQPQIVPNTTSNTITVRATTSIAAVIEQVIAANDKPRAEVVVDVEILEVNRERARQYGLDLTQYSIGGLFSPRSEPAVGTAPNTVASSAFNANLLSEGVSLADFYLAVPAAIVDFLESDSETRLVAKPQLRGQEGTQLTLNLGDDIPVPTTSFTAIATGGVAVNPLTSFEYRAVGVNLKITPRVTYDNEIILDLEVENSTLGGEHRCGGPGVANVWHPSGGSPGSACATANRICWRGCCGKRSRRSLRGFPGILHLPIIRQLFSSNDESISSTDIIMLLTPRIVRTHELTQQDVSPIFIGTQQNMGVTGPPPLIAPVDRAALEPGSPAGDGGVSPRDLGFVAGGAPTTFGAQVELVPAAGTDLTLGSEGYTVPISISGASQLSTLSLSLTFNPEVLRVSTIQEGSFMQQGSASVTFAQDVNPETGRVDLALTRTGDQTGAAGSGLVASVVFEPIAQGASILSPSGLGLTPTGAPLALSFAPTTVSVR